MAVVLLTVGCWQQCHCCGYRLLTEWVRQPTDREQLLKLLQDADVLITNLRSGALARMGLDSESVTRQFPQLVIYASIYASISVTLSLSLCVCHAVAFSLSCCRFQSVSITLSLSLCLCHAVAFYLCHSL